MNALGRQVTLDFHDCQGPLDDVAFLRQALTSAAKKGRATIIKDHFHRFSPQGVSGILIIAESHIALHTWPEFAFAAVDLFTCGTTVDPWEIKDSLERDFASGQVSFTEMKRGLVRGTVPQSYPPAQPPSAPSDPME